MAINKSKPTNNISKKIATAASVVIAAATIGAGSYGLGVATSDGLRDAPENYTITQQEYNELDKTIYSFIVRTNTSSIPEYSRSSLSTDWKDLDGNGCNTRYDVLVSNFRKYARYNSDSCEIKSGTIYDYYNGKLLKYNKKTDSGGGIQIDHIVSIGNGFLGDTIGATVNGL